MTELGWGRYPRPAAQRLEALTSAEIEIRGPALARGLGRSYGDSCLLSHGTLLSTKFLDHFLNFDEASGLIEVEAGVTIGDLIEVMGPRGWFVPVTPGTKFVTIGGAIANDVHGKNYHHHGSFGHFVRSLRLKRSDGSVLKLSPTENAQLFYATIGGLGLTGLILSAELQLIRVKGPYITEEVTPYRGLDEFMRLSEESADFPYVVSWIGAPSAWGDVHGIMLRGRHSDDPGPWLNPKPRLHIPIDAPNFTLNRWSVAAFNALYYRMQARRRGVHRVHYRPFFYPLDSVGDWNRIYGRRGFVQYQFVVPQTGDGVKALRSVFRKLSHARVGSFLSVLKTFGHKQALGLMSFPRPGITLAMDFPVTGPELFRLLNACDDDVLSAGGALYPAKDARMSKAAFRQSFPRLEEFKTMLDPQFVSDFWRRVT